jgi:hypothetical protein
MTQTTINRRRALAVVAAVPAAVALAAPALASAGEDADLRQLWAKYLKQVEAYRVAHGAYRLRRDVLEAELGPKVLPRTLTQAEYQKHWAEFDRLWETHSLEPLSKAWNREAREVARIVKAIRKAKAETVFGVGVKLAVLEDITNLDEYDVVQANDDALRAICDLTGVDFIATRLEV